MELSIYISRHLGFYLVLYIHTHLRSYCYLSLGRWLCIVPLEGCLDVWLYVQIGLSVCLTDYVS